MVSVQRSVIASVTVLGVTSIALWSGVFTSDANDVAQEPSPNLNYGADSGTGGATWGLVDGTTEVVFHPMTEGGDDEEESGRDCDVQGNCTGGLTGNTSFLGEVGIHGQPAFPLNQLSYNGMTLGPATLTRVTVTRCRINGELVSGDYTAGPELPMDSKGTLLTKEFSNAAAGPCTVGLDDWDQVGATLHIHYDDGSEEFDAEVRIHGMTDELSSYGRRAYTLMVNSNSVPDDRRGRHPLCAEDPDQPTNFSAFFFKDLNVDDKANFSQQQGAFYMGCMSGAVGKSHSAKGWNYEASEITMEGHELVTAAIMDNVCNDGVSHTKPGTPVVLQGRLSDSDPHAAPWDPETLAGEGFVLGSMWKKPPAPAKPFALCTDQVRNHSEWQPKDIDDEYVCPGGVSIPRCSPAFAPHADMIVWHRDS